MQTLIENLKRFRDMKWSEIIAGRQQDLLGWVKSLPTVPAENQNNDDNLSSTFHFSFNTQLLAEHFQNLSPNSTALPFIEFSAIGLLSAPDDTTQVEQTLALIEEARKQKNFEDIPFIVAVDWGYFMYGNTDGCKWAFRMLDPSLMDSIKFRFTTTPFLLNYNLQHANLYHHILEKKAHIHFSTRAQQVAQIQKAYNSTFYAQNLLTQAEQTISSLGAWSLGVGVYQLLNGKILDDICNIITLLSDTELEIPHRLKNEVAELLQVLEAFKKFSDITSDAPPPTPREYTPTYSFQTGHAVGFIADHIHREDGQWDIEVFSQFSVDLPKHIDMLTTLINHHNSKIAQHAPNISSTQLRALQEEATQLLNTLKNTQNNAVLNQINPVFQIVKIINYAFLTRQIITLASATLNQIEHLHDAYQETMRDILTILQEEGFSLLAHYAAHIEIELMLQPGLLMNPVLGGIHAFNRCLKERIHTLADFSFLGEHLLTVGNSKFTSQLEANIQTHYQESQQAVQQILWAEEALLAFLNDLPAGQPEILQTHFALIIPYLEKINPSLNRDISRALFDSEPITIPDDVIRALRRELSAYLKKLRATELLRAQQCQAVQTVVPQLVQLELFPYQAHMGCDMTLMIMDDLSLDELNLPKNHPVLIQDRKSPEHSYQIYGNTDGTKWECTGIPASFIPPKIIELFTQLHKAKLETDKQPFYALKYHPEFKKFYQQMSFKKAHTHFISQFSNLESHALEISQQSLTTLVSKPLGWIWKVWQNHARPAEQPDSGPALNRALLPTARRLNQYHDSYSLEDLSAEQALTIYSWYQQKIANYGAAIAHLEQFKLLVNRTFPNQFVHFDEKTEIQQQCLYLYHIIRPYLIDIQNFSELDLKMCTALSVNRRLVVGQPQLHCREINQILGQFSLDDGEIRTFITSWKRRSAELLVYAHNQLKAHGRRTLTARRGSFALPERHEFILQTTNTSKKIIEFQESLKKWLPLLNKKILAQLKPQKGKIPYPEIKDLNQQLQHPPLLLFLKRLFNALYLLEQVVKGIEGIKKSTTFRSETINLIAQIGYNHGPDMYDVGLQLSADPVLSEVFQDIYQLYTSTLQKILNLTQPYTTDMKKIMPRQDYGMRLIVDTNEVINIPKDCILTLIKHKNDYYLYSKNAAEEWELEQLPRKLISKLKIDFTKSYLAYAYSYQPLYDRILQKQKAPPPALWYSLNAFYTLPAHILSITGERHLDLEYGIRLMVDVGEDVSIPTAHNLTLVQHQNDYYIFGNGRGEDWQLHKVPTALIKQLNIDFKQDYLNYDHSYQLLYDYLIQNDLHFTDINALQMTAKNVTQNIEQIIRDSNSYFRLFFLDAFMIYQLNQSLQAQLPIFTRTTQGALFNNLKKLQENCFAPVFVKMDTKENERGLAAGTLTTPLESVITEWFHGFIFPLKKTYQEKAMLCSELMLTLTQARILAEQNRLADLSARSETSSPELENFISFTQLLNDFKTASSTGFVGYISGKVLSPMSPALEEQYRKDIHPKLKQESEKYIPEWIQNTYSTLNRDNLDLIKEQVTTYYQNLSRLSLLHNHADRALCEALPMFLARLDVLSVQRVNLMPAELCAEYLNDILPNLLLQRQSYIPKWLHPISYPLDRNCMDAVLTQTQAYVNYVLGQQATQKLYKALSEDKLVYLQGKLNDHNLLNKQEFCTSFAKHHVHTMIHRLVYQACDLHHYKIHKEYHSDLKNFLLAQEVELLNNLSPSSEVDEVLNARIQEKITEFNQRYFERFQRFDRVQTAINAFKDYLLRDQRIPSPLRIKKMNCLNDLEDILYQKGELPKEIEACLNRRSQLLEQCIQNNEALLLEHHTQFNNIIDWLLDCITALFIALGLYTPERHIYYAKLRKADKTVENLPSNWLHYTFHGMGSANKKNHTRIIVPDTVYQP